MGTCSDEKFVGILAYTLHASRRSSGIADSPPFIQKQSGHAMVQYDSLSCDWSISVSVVSGYEKSCR